MVNIARRKLKIAIAGDGFADHCAVVASRTIELETQGTGHGRFRPAAVGRAMQARIAPNDAPCCSGRCPAMAQPGQSQIEERCEAGREKIDGVIKPRRRPAKINVAGRAVADHAVSCIDDLAGHHAGDSQQDQPEQRSDNPIGEVFGEALDSGPRDARLVKFGDVATNDAGHRLTPVREPSKAQGKADVTDMGKKTALCQQARSYDDENCCSDPCGFQKFVQHHGDQPTAEDEHAHDQNPAAAAITRRTSGFIAVSISPSEDVTKPGDGMPYFPIETRRIRNESFNRQSRKRKIQMQNNGHIPRLAPSGLAAKFWSHGGQLALATELFADAPQPFMDLSTGINPHSLPLPNLPSVLFERLPDAGQTILLEQIAAQAYGSGAPACVVAVPGTQGLIQRLPEILPARSVGILGPTYGGHAIAWKKAGVSVTPLEAVAELQGFDVAVVVNPNNPDGRLVAPADLEALRLNNRHLIVDEAFVDFLPMSASFAAQASQHGSNVIVLRSFGKAYGLAGIRLGFAIARHETADLVRRSFGEWAVSGPAQYIGIKALADVSWRQNMAKRLGDDSQRLVQMLQAAGWMDYGGTSLFRLARHPDALGWFEHLANQGILTRPFMWDTNLLRFGLPGNVEEWERLSEALSTGASGARV